MTTFNIAVTARDSTGLTGTGAATITTTGGAVPWVGTGFDANGWTTFTASTDTRTVYVSNSTGNDSNSGLTQALAVKTIAKGLTLIRNGFPDWLLLKAGDTWLNQQIGSISFNGRSKTEPILLSSYGTGARPLMKTASGADSAIGTNSNGTNIAIVGLDFYAYTRNPSDAGFISRGPEISGMSFLGPVNNLLIEDCKFSFYAVNAIQAGTPMGGVVVLRRNIIADNYATGGHSEGLYMEKITTPIFEENLFDHNGWNSAVSGAGATIYNQGLYIQNDCGLATVTRNIFTFSSATGVQVRPGGTVTGNLFVRNPIAFQIGSTETGMVAGSSTVTGNVVTEGNDIDASNQRGWGLVVYPLTSTANVQIHSNIIAHQASLSQDGLGVSLESGANRVVLTNNIIYQWFNPILNFGNNNTTSPNAINKTGYIDPNRSVASYMTSIAATPATLAGFITAARGQSKANWQTKYTAAAVNSYIIAGFV